jgi:molybdenum cofactor cytidylyltransferase
VLENPDPDSEQIHSLRIALRHIPPDTGGVMVTPVDVPLVSASLVDALIGALRESGAPVALPVAGERHGHPVLFGGSVLGELGAEDLTGGARTVVHRHLGEAAMVPVPADVLRDVDTPGELRWIQDRS